MSKEIQFGVVVPLEKFERKMNQFISVIEDNFYIHEGTGIRKSIEMESYSLSNNLIFAMQVKLESALPVKKHSRAFIFSKLLAKEVERVLKNIYEKEGVDTEEIQNSFPYDYIHEEEKDNEIILLDNSLMSQGDFRYMDILRLYGYVKTKVLNGEFIVNKFSEFAKKIKREMLIEISKYNEMISNNKGGVLLAKDDKLALEFWLLPKDEEKLIFEIRKKDLNLNIEKEKNMLSLNMKDNINVLNNTIIDIERDTYSPLNFRLCNLKHVAELIENEIVKLIKK